MQKQERWSKLTRVAACIGVAAGTLAAFSLQQAQAQEPIRIGFGMAMTGPLAANGKSALLGMKIWEEDINKKGGLIGRPVRLVYYDDQSNPSTVPGLYAKLLDIDKVDVIVSGYATNMIAPAMPVAMQRGKVFPALFGTGINSEFNYNKYFAMIPTGPDPKPAFTKPFFDVAAGAEPEAGDHLADGCGRRVRSQRLRWRAPERQGGRLEDRLRQDLSADHHRLRPDHPRDPGRQPRRRCVLLLSARTRWG